jgi:two-component system response regulator ChvI
MSEPVETIAADPHARASLVLVDDDPLFLSTLAMNLEDAGFDVAAFGGGQAALDHLARVPRPSALLLDWQMPGMDGLEVLRRVREAGVDSPAIFLTSLTQPIYEELALDRGAVDFVEKSRSFSIILKRLRLITEGRKQPPIAGRPGAAPTIAAAAARTATPAEEAPLQLRRDTCRAAWRGHELPLTLTEFKVVALLADNTGADVSYRQIYDLVRGEGFVAGYGEEGYRGNVRAMVKRIRQKFRDVDPDFDDLQNYAGFGYRWRTADGKSDS